MTDFIDRLGKQLTLASERLHDTSVAAVPARRRWRIRRPEAIALVGAAMTGSALAATHPWQPSLGRPAMSDVPSGTSRSSVPSDQRALLGVLRRPQSDSDRGPRAGALLRSLGPEQAGVRTASVRLLRSPSGKDAVLVSAERSGAGEAAESDPLCLLDPEGGTCATTEALKEGRFFLLAGPEIYGIVPDGVAQVVLDYPDGETRTASVHDNFFAVLDAPVAHRTIPGAGAPMTVGLAPRIKWLDGGGHVVGPPLRQ